MKINGKLDGKVKFIQDFEQPSKIFSCLGDEEIFISGIAIRCAESENMADLKDHLLKGTNMVTVDSRKYPTDFYPIPDGLGKMSNLSKIDAAFFNISGKFADAADPQLRILLELSYEAIVDAGFNPQHLRGSRTGVFVGNTISETLLSCQNELKFGYSLLGSVRAMFSNRISHYFDFVGPSYCVDATNSTGLTCLDNAVHYMRNGSIDYALVATAHMISRPMHVLDFVKLGFIAEDNTCRVFDAAADGTALSDGIGVLFLQRSSLARRCYCSILHVKSSSDGYKENGFLSSKSGRRKMLLEETYTEAGVDFKDVAYLEAHANGTKDDVEEMNMVTDVFCKNRQDSLLVGSVKSNMGDSETSSGLCQLAKIIIASETGIIPANLHFNKPNPEIPGLMNGSLKVITENTPWNGGIVAINSFGLGGTSAHAIVKTYTKEKIKNDDKTQRLFVISSRSKDGVEAMLDAVEKNPDMEMLALLTDLMDYPSSLNYFRGYTVANSEAPVREIQMVYAQQRPLWYVFSGMGCQWIGMGRDMMQVDVFRNSMLNSHKVLKPMGIELMDLIMTATDKEFESTIINAFVTIAAIQIALVDCLNALGLSPDGIIGHSLGELGCAYADGGFTAEEMLLASYWRGHCVFYGDLPPGAMAAVGMSAEEVLKRCPSGVVAACHNSKESVTISGPPDAVQELVEQLKAEKIFVRPVKSTGKAFHCYMVNKIAPTLLAHLEELIPNPKPRTSRWISTSVLKENWDSPDAQLCSGKYFANNLVNHVYFSEGMEFIPKNAIVLEIGPHCLLQSIVKQMLTTEATYLGLARRNHPDNLQLFLECMGKLYLSGYNFKPSRLLPKVEFPVSRGTPMISPLIRWDHSSSWPVCTYDTFDQDNPICACSQRIILKPTESSNENAYFLEYLIDGNYLVPLAKYLDIVWKAVAKTKLVMQNQIGVHFENLHFHRYIPIQGLVNFQLMLMKGSRRFDLLQNGEIVLTGYAYAASDKAPVDLTYAVKPENTGTGSDLKAKAIYDTFKCFGYDYGPAFQGILDMNINDETITGHLKWNQNWIAFLEYVFQFLMFRNVKGELRLPQSIQTLRIAPTNLMVENAPTSSSTSANTESGENDRCNESSTIPEPATIIPIWGDPVINTYVAGDVQIKGFKTAVCPRNQFQHLRPVLEESNFVPFNEDKCLAEFSSYENDLQGYSSLCCNIIKQGCQKLLDSKTLFLPEAGVLSSLIKTTVPSSSVSNKASFYENATFNLNLKLTLEGIFNLPIDKNIRSNISISLKNSSLLSDNLIVSLLHRRALKPCLDIVASNVSLNNVTIVEAGASRSPFMNSLLDVYVNSKVKINYILTESTKNAVSSMRIENEGVQCDVWNVEETPLQNVKTDLIVMKHSLIHYETSLMTIVQHVSDSLTNGGFALFYEMIPDTIISKFVAYLHNFTSGASEKMLKEAFAKANLSIISEKSDGILNKLYLVRKVSVLPSIQLFVPVNTPDKWFLPLKKYLKDKSAKSNVWLISEKEPTNGLIGFVNSLCEEGYQRVRCIINDGSKSGKHIYEEIMRNDLLVNTLKNGKWGSSHYFPMKNSVKSETKVKVKHAYVAVKHVGDLTSVGWIPSEYNNLNDSGRMQLCDVYYAAIQKHEVDIALGNLPRDESRLSDFYPGIEFSGRNASGHRVMGCVSHMGLSTTVKPDSVLTWTVPNHWTLEQAATVPVAYTLAYYALYLCAELKPTDSILIHCGCGSVGLAAIAIALDVGCKIFTTVGSEEKRNFLKKRFPKLTDENIGNSRNTNYENQILCATKGNGVDVILNPLGGSKIHTTFQCISFNGKFVQIGRFSPETTRQLGLKIFMKNLTFIGAYLDRLIGGNNATTQKLHTLVDDGIKTGVVQPLPTNVFSLENQVNAFKLVSTGKHIGKVILKIRDEEKGLSNQASTVFVSVDPIIQCHPHKAYVISGNFGDFGLALAHWLIEKGVCHLSLNVGVMKLKDYQHFQVMQWIKDGIDVQISTENVATTEGAQKLFKETTSKQGSVAGVFFIDSGTKDTLFETQTVDNFKNTMKEKIGAVQELDKASRTVCSELNWFVVFSSFVSRFGCERQTNHGYTNSIIEQIMEKRHYNNLPALNLQLCTSLDADIFSPFVDGKNQHFNGAKPQSISSCLQTLETVLCQSSPVVSSLVLPQRVIKTEHQKLLTMLNNIYGEKNEISPQTPLVEAGVDELTASGIKQILFNCYNQALLVPEILQMTKQQLLQRVS